MERRMLDMSTYPRKQHFDYFRTMQNPWVGLTVPVDVTELAAFCKRKHYSFYLCFIHAAALAADGVQELRQRICGEAVVEYGECPTSHTEISGDGTYCYCTLRHHMPFVEYIEYAERERQLSRERGSIEEDEDADSHYFVSSLPWLNYTAIIQPTTNTESNPRITWGAYAEDFRGRLMMPVSLLCNHALADGSHIAQFYSLLEKEMNNMYSE